MSTMSQDRTRLQVEVRVDVPVEHAFRVFTERFDEIKPRDHSLLAVPIERTVLEPYAGGKIYDVGVDGSTCAWSRILVHEPPHRLVITWDISPRWEVETDLDRTSEIEVQFLAEAPERTRVVLEHRHLDRHGEGWEDFTSLKEDTGWPLYLERFRGLTDRLAPDTADAG